MKTRGQNRRRPDRLKVFTRRAAIITGVQGLLFTTLAGRLYYLQVIENSRYRMLADENRISVRLLAPPRGRIVDRAGRIMASNRADYRAFLIPEQTRDVHGTLAALGRIIPLTAENQARIMTAIGRQKSFMPVTLAANLEWEDFAKINMASPDLPGVIPDVGTTRHYPYGELAAHVLGYVGAPNEQEAGRDPLLLMPGFRIGKNGLERTYDRDLRGLAGNTKVEVNAYGRVIRELEREEAIPGRDIQLTIDLELQKFTAERIAHESASAVVMDISNGDILTLASMPAYDPNDFNVGIRTSVWQELLQNERKPLINKAVSGQYPPGSTFKMIVALAAMEAGVITPRHEVYCSGRRRLGNHLFHCWRHRGHGTMDMIAAIQQSCDIYFYEIADKVGIDRIAEMARRFGLGHDFDISIPHVARGLVPTSEWKLRTTGVPWQRGETYVAGIGQGFLLSTPLQLAIMTARMANGGRAVIPRLVRPPVELETSDFPSVGVSDYALATVLQGMADVTMTQRGTAFAYRITAPGYSMAGKTGTSQVRAISREERATGIIPQEERPWNQRHHALFVGYGPIEAPRYAVSVVVEHGGSGSRAAAPLARDILLQTMQIDAGRAPVLPPPRQMSPTSGRAV